MEIYGSKAYWKEKLEEAKLDREVYLDAMRYESCKDDGKRDDKKIDAIATKLASVISTIASAKQEIKKLEESEGE